MSDKPLEPNYFLSLQDQSTEFLLYTVPSGDVKVEVLLNNETLWLKKVESDFDREIKKRLSKKGDDKAWNKIN